MLFFGRSYGSGLAQLFGNDRAARKFEKRVDEIRRRHEHGIAVQPVLGESSEAFCELPAARFGDVCARAAHFEFSRKRVLPRDGFPADGNAVCVERAVGIVFNGKKLYGIYDFFRRGACAGVELRDRLRKIAVFCVQSKQLRAAF